VDAIVGFVVVLISFFTLPLRFIRRSWSELSEIGRRRSVQVEGGEDIPLLNWLLVLGRALISIGAVLVYIIMVIAAAASDSGGAVVLTIIFGPLVSFAIIWFYGIILELLSLQILVVRNTRQIIEAVRETGSTTRTVMEEP
jgi:hypothetical protein